MNKKGVIILYLSYVVFALALIPFIWFMIHPMVTNLVKALIVVGIGALLYIIGSRLITHKTYNYSVFQARTFYKLCLSNNLTSLKLCKLNSDKVLELAKSNKFSEALNIKALWEMYEIGCNFDTEMKG